MIPELPTGISDENLLDFYSSLGGNLSDQSTIHIRWWTHRQNPSVCWICDQNVLITKLLEITGRYITKSSVDMETSSMSESDSEIEIENEGSVEPEYNVDEEEQAF